uniref:Flavodoxin-like domain-containing protein n=1 Tax=Emiliania huxleyi TaxID=2903 RepID=A0A7S3VWG8_EMIHU
MLSAVLALSPESLVLGSRATVPARASANMGVGLLYSTTTGNTETVAGYLSAEIGVDAVDIADAEDLASFDGLIIGAPTWHTGADSERSGTAWDDYLYGDLTSADLKGKKVAIFGLGDQAGYGDNFCDAMDELKSCFEKQGAEVIGAWSADGYDHTESKSEAGGTFVGLACDEDNQPDQSEERVKAWVAQLKSEGMPL